MSTKWPQAFCIFGESRYILGGGEIAYNKDKVFYSNRSDTYHNFSSKALRPLKD